MKKVLLAFIIFNLSFSAFFTVPQVVKAQTYMGGCTTIGQCINNKKCVKDGNNIVYPNGGACGSSQIGGVAEPEAVRRLNLLSSVQGNDPNGIGIVLFLSKLINLFVIVCGIWTLFNFLYSGYVLITSMGDVKAQSEVKDRVTMTAIGLAIIAGAYIIAGLIGLIFFGDATFILNPKLTSALGG